MKKIRCLIVCMLLPVLLLLGCGSGEPAEQPKGDFRFPMPEGYTIFDVTDTACRILRDADGAAIGAMETTTLTIRDLKKDTSGDIMEYLQTSFHQTNNVEYIASYWGDQHPMVSINLRRHGDDGTQKEFIHRFFEKDGCVYHMWFDLDVTAREETELFTALTGVD